MKRLILVLASLVLVVLLIASCGGISKTKYQKLEAERNALQTDITTAQSSINSLTSENVKLNNELVGLRNDYDSLESTSQSSINSLTSENEELNNELTGLRNDYDNLESKYLTVQKELQDTQTNLKIYEDKLNLYKDTLGIDVLSGVQPLDRKSASLNSMVNLVNNSNAVNPTWQQLESFILSDKTDEELYQPDIFMCGSFAEMVHNHAEAAGIRAAYIHVDFEDGSDAHALNAFKTTDKGLIYIDCTGEQISAVTIGEKEVIRDKVAYVAKGKEYGVISLGNDTPLDYKGYEKMRNDWDSYEKQVEIYNHKVERYNNEISGKVYYIGTPEWNSIQQWEGSLTKESQDLERLRAQLELVYKPLSIVKSIEIYW